MKKVKIAQIGINKYSHSNEILHSILKQSDLFEFVGYVLPENERERINFKTGDLSELKELTLDEVLESPEIEAVSIETDEIYLTKYALLAAKAGKHIHMEKPGSPSLADFEELIGAVKASGKVFHTGYMYRYNPYVVDLMQKIKDGALGEIISVEAQMNCSHIKKTRQWLEELPAGMMFYLGCHLVDLILQIQGTPERIIPLNKCTGIDGVTSTEFGMAVFEYKNGVSFAKTSAVEFGGFARRQLVVSGSKGTVELKPFELPVADGLLYTGRNECFSSAWSAIGESSKSEPYDRYDTMIASFADYIRGNKTNPYTPDYELELFKTVLKACGK